MHCDVKIFELANGYKYEEEIISKDIDEQGNEIEKMKSIEHKYNEQIEVYKAELTQQSFRYSKVFDSTEKVIVSIYQQIIQLKAAASMQSLFSP